MPNLSIGVRLKTAKAKRWVKTWQRFKRHKRGYVSLVLFLLLFSLSMVAEIISNDLPLIIRYEGKLYFPIFVSYPETTFGGDFETETDYKDRFVIEKFNRPGNWIVFPLNRHSYNTINQEISGPVPSPPTWENLLGTDDRGRDVLARIIYGFRLSVLFGLTLTMVGTTVGIVAGALQGYFGGRIDLFMQRCIEIWGAMPELYLLIIFASIFKPSFLLLLLTVPDMEFLEHL